MPGTVMLETQSFSQRESNIHCYLFNHFILLPYARVNCLLFYYLIIKATFIFVTV